MTKKHRNKLERMVNLHIISYCTRNIFNKHKKEVNSITNLCEMFTNTTKEVGVFHKTPTDIITKQPNECNTNERM